MQDSSAGTKRKNWTPTISLPSAGHFLVKSVNGGTIVTFANPKVVLEAREPLYDLVEKEGHRRIVLNFENVRFLSSAAIGVLIHLKKKVEAVRGIARFRPRPRCWMNLATMCPGE